MWLGLGLALLWTAVTVIAVWLLTRLFPKTERPSPPNPTNDPLLHWQACFERGEISGETLALIQKQIEQNQTKKQRK